MSVGSAVRELDEIDALDACHHIRRERARGDEKDRAG